MWKVIDPQLGIMFCLISVGNCVAYTIKQYFHKRHVSTSNVGTFRWQSWWKIRPRNVMPQQYVPACPSAARTHMQWPLLLNLHQSKMIQYASDQDVMVKSLTWYGLKHCFEIYRYTKFGHFFTLNVVYWIFVMYSRVLYGYNWRILLINSCLIKIWS